MYGDLLGEDVFPHDALVESRHRGTSRIRKRTLLGPYRRLMPRAKGGSKGGGRILMGEIPL